MNLTNLGIHKYAAEDGAEVNLFPEIAAAALPFLYYTIKKKRAALAAIEAITNISKTKLAPQVEKALSEGVLKVIDDRAKLEVHVDNMFPKLKRFPVVRDMIVKKLNQTILEANNAAFVAPRRPGVDPVIILSPGKRGTAIEAHEVGHFLDFQNSGAGTARQFHKTFRPVWSRVRTAFGGKAQNTPYYKGEARAWDLGGISPEELTRQKALHAYEVGLQSNRAPVVSAIGATGVYVVHKPFEEDNIE